MVSEGWRQDGHVAIVTLSHGENRFNPTFIKHLLGIMDEIEENTNATTLLVHSSHEKIFSNGIDLEWMLQVMQANDLPTAKCFFYELNRLFKRLLAYPLITIASITGHAFAAGAIFTCAFDFRFMRKDRGYFCLPEIDLGLPFLPGMNAILRTAVPENVLRLMQLGGIRFTAQMCREHNIVQGAFHMDNLMAEVLDFARQQDKKRAVIKEIKARVNQSVINAIDVEDPPYIESGKYHLG